ncbi:MAG: hypothetical protein LUH05_05800, partial [Candidatus Gastranaerophilales bacterium]|nr:hypothetical protein [Candidatus Gastranaerophilales bacterium]
MSVFLKDAFDSYISDNYKNAVLSAMSVAEKYCIKIFLIGGIVRDLILNNPVKDIDIAVECDAVEFCKILEKEIPCKIISTQENLRTAKVQFKNSAEIDFASTREEKYTQPGILPVAYNFGCPLKFDVKRRDFTINTLALDLTSTDKFYVIDYFDGFKDIQNKKLKVLHNKSFIDDPSRIIRLLKFQTRFNFDIEENTLTLMNEY